jgi:small-conductance mechanosensitive channel
MNRLTSAPSSLAHGALAGIAAFPLIVVVLHLVQAGSYHPLSQAVSELALGRAGWLMAVAFCSLGTGTLLLAATLRRLTPRPRVAPWLIAVAGLLSYVSAFVHADGSGPATTHGKIHQIVGVVTFILMIAGMFSLARAFRHDPAWRSAAKPTLIWALAAAGGFFLIPISGSAYFGLAQRIFLAVILSWALMISLRAARQWSAGHALERSGDSVAAATPY